VNQRRRTTLKGKKKNGGAHGKDDDADGPAVDELIIPLIVFRLIDDFWREVTRRPTHRLRTTHTEPSLSLSIPAWGACTHLEHGEAIDDFGESKVGDLDVWWVVFCQKNVLRENEFGGERQRLEWRVTSGLRSRCVMPLAWMYCKNTGEMRPSSRTALTRTASALHI
jgi:hypothetical protein